MFTDYPHRKSSAYKELLLDHGYAFLPGTAYSAAQLTGTEFSAFLTSWESLERDAYIATPRAYRFRRYGRAIKQTDGNFTVLEPGVFFQSRVHNAMFGDLDRRFAPIANRDMHNPTLRIIIDSTVDLLPELDGSDLVIGVHQIRIVGTKGHPGKPAPEGIHRDGYRFVSTHLIRRSNVSGGESHLYNDAGGLVGVALLKDLFDTLVIDDTRMLHSVSPVSTSSSSADAIRDVLVLTYDTI